MNLPWTRTLAVWWSLLWRTVLLAFLLIVGVILGLRAGGYPPEETQALMRRYRAPLGCSALAIMTVLSVKLTIKKHFLSLAGPAADVSWKRALAVWWGLLWRGFLSLVFCRGLVTGLIAAALFFKGYSAEEKQAFRQRHGLLIGSFQLVVASIAAVRLAVPKHLPAPAAPEAATTRFPWKRALAVWWSLLWRGVLLAALMTVGTGVFLGIVFSSKGYSREEYQAATQPYQLPLGGLLCAIASIAAVRMVLKKPPAQLSGSGRGGPAEEFAAPPSWARTFAVWWGLAWRNILLGSILGLVVGGVIGDILGARGFSTDQIQAFLRSYNLPLGSLLSAVALIAAVKLAFPKHLAAIAEARRPA